METTVPWEVFMALIKPVYLNPSSKGGRPTIPLEVILRIHLLYPFRGRDAPAQDCAPAGSSLSDQVAVRPLADLRDLAAGMA